MGDECEACIVFKVQNGITEPNICGSCGEKELVWRQNEDGFLNMECFHCHETIFVDLNTPCELDTIFDQKIKLMVESRQKMLEKETIAEMSKAFKINVLGMRKLLAEGISMDVTLEEAEEMSSLMDRYGISYRFENYEDCKQKYPFYKECKYPYSKMRILIR